MRVLGTVIAMEDFCHTQLTLGLVLVNKIALTLLVVTFRTYSQAFVALDVLLAGLVVIRDGQAFLKKIFN